VIFGATGRRKAPNDFASSWDIYAAAPKQFARIAREHTTNRIAERLASAWGDEVKKKFQRYGEAGIVGIEGSGIAGAMFADFEADGSLLIVHEVVNYERSGNILVISANTNVIPSSSVGSHMMGKGEIIQEFDANSTPRSLIWRKMMNQRLNASFDRIAEVAIAAVDLTIDNLPKTHIDRQGVPFSDVGPPVAAVRLRRDKGVDWVQIGACQTQANPKRQPH
jgi:hypothetical protein